MYDCSHGERKRSCGQRTRAAAGLLLACLATGSVAQAQPAPLPSRGTHPEHMVPDKAQLERRLASMGFLLEKSSAARQIEASGDAGARERQAKALESYKQAQAAFQAEDYAGAARLLAEAGALIAEGTRLAAPAQVNGEKQRKDFNARLASVKALLAADVRIAAEKPAAPGAAEGGSIENMIAEATRLADAGNLTEGRALLDRAYLVARAAVSSMRRGDTLARSAHFANAQEEYQYEIERNNTHQALLQSLLGDERSARNAEGAVRESAQTAARLRREAERNAAAAGHAAAIKQLEESTHELLRAIRGLGIRVPGG